MAIGTNNNTLATRIQLKSDVEANWDLVPNFIPKTGELIIYAADNDHEAPRLKVGDGRTPVGELPFIDAGSLNGNESFIVKCINFNNFPFPGDPNKLYIDLSKNLLYHYTPTGVYKRLSDFQVTTATIHEVASWKAGRMTKAEVKQSVLTVRNGSEPELLWPPVEVVTNITGGVS